MTWESGGPRASIRMAAERGCQCVLYAREPGALASGRLSRAWRAWAMALGRPGKFTYSRLSSVLTLHVHVTWYRTVYIPSIGGHSTNRRQCVSVNDERTRQKAQRGKRKVESAKTPTRKLFRKRRLKTERDSRRERAPRGAGLPQLLTPRWPRLAKAGADRRPPGIQEHYTRALPTAPRTSRGAAHVDTNRAATTSPALRPVSVAPLQGPARHTRPLASGARASWRCHAAGEVHMCMGAALRAVPSGHGSQDSAAPQVQVYQMLRRRPPTALARS